MYLTQHPSTMSETDYNYYLRYITAYKTDTLQYFIEDFGVVSHPYRVCDPFTRPGAWTRPGLV
jgi:hypothetical protein